MRDLYTKYFFAILFGIFSIVAIGARSSDLHEPSYIFGGLVIAIGVAIDFTSSALIVQNVFATKRGERHGPSPFGILSLFWYGAGLWVIWPHVTWERGMIFGISFLGIHVISYFLIPLLFLFFIHTLGRQAQGDK